MTRVVPRFDTLAAARYVSGPDEKRINLEEVFGENVFGLHQMASHLFIFFDYFLYCR
jgi:hypothetical protein